MGSAAPLDTGDGAGRSCRRVHGRRTRRSPRGEGGAVSRGADPGSFSLVIDGVGTVNGIRFTAKGRGEGSSVTGDLAYEVEFSDLHDGTDPFANLLAVLILPTGLFGRELHDGENLLTIAGGEFRFRQLLAGDGVSAQASGKLSLTGDREFTFFSQAEGDVDFASVSEIHPFSVIMIPAGVGKLIETIEWPIVDRGEVKRVYAIRHFTFEPTQALRREQLRDVRIEPPRADGLRLQLRINSAIRPFRA
jgi:hypothetical protein